MGAPKHFLDLDRFDSGTLRAILDLGHAFKAGPPPGGNATPLAGNRHKVQLARVSVQRAILLAAGLETGGF